MNTEGDYELGRPRYQAGERGGGQEQAGSPPPVRKTAPSAIAAMAFAAVGWLLPVFGGVVAIRRARTAMREIEAADGALDGVPLAVWARRLGWIYVVVWSVVLFYLALQLYVGITNVVVK